MSLALYRKYRPGTFAEVKGQEHVTDPLRQALRTGRINHAYLFSGPRGCGKTSSARILARSLNCAKGPTPDPCGECESCVALAPTGPGHLDVIEIDAASHGGVDDARDLRERAFFAPVSARYKIYIIDEAHMVTREGFNALLKLVEEPPPHLKFIFATTEPEKVIGTIKSRTHHYPFRLMPPATLKALMEEILTSESVPYEPAALPLVVRAGAGSARDSLSILDQLLAGADDDGITYAKAVSLLGYTDGDLLDEVVDAFARREGAAVFHTVNRVIEGGHDPRRFAADLLERFRDLVILANVPEAATSGLLDRPADELERLVAQAASMGPAELTRAAELFNAGLTEMRGATSPRLLLELMCARVLLPGAAQGEGALLARLERLERGGVVAQMASRPAPGGTAGTHGAGAAAGSYGEPAASMTTSGPSGAAAASGDAAGSPAAVTSDAGSGQAGTASAPSGAAAPSTPGTGGTGSGAPGVMGAASGSGAASAGDDWPETVRPGAPTPQPEQPVQQAPAYAPPAAGGAGQLQQQWPAVLAALKKRSIVVWANVNTNAQVVGVEGNVVTLGFSQVGAMKNFTGGGKDAVVAGALGDVLGGTWRVEAVVGGSPAPQGRPPQPGPGAPQAPHGGPSGGPGVSPGGPGVSPGGFQGGPAGNGGHGGAPAGTGVAGTGVAGGGAPEEAASTGGFAGGAAVAGVPGGDAYGGAPGAGVPSGGAAGGVPGAGVPGGGASGGAPGAGVPGGSASGGVPVPGVPGGGASAGAPGAGVPGGGVVGGASGAGAPAGASSVGVAGVGVPEGAASGAVAPGGGFPGGGASEGLGDGGQGGVSGGDQRERLTTDESWPQAPDDPDPGMPPMPSPTQGTSRSSGSAQAARTPSPGLAAARSAAKAAAQAAAQAGPRVPASRQGGGSGGWPDAIPGRQRGPESDDVDPLNDANADVDELSGMALLQRELGAQMIGEIDHT
ncbi:hypothetical protein GCM10010404_33360 [Nonomuraea africana]|uniref:DNA-directed DNA polymerase n=1 Tax=Nonomuraea africana TaxID=46171 RepID=A0ABR9KS08_9ACTN|nr:DNA polymerase-3 subunit gamma/tau [Nonomuraea africana]